MVQCLLTTICAFCCASICYAISQHTIDLSKNLACTVDDILAIQQKVDSPVHRFCVVIIKSCDLIHCQDDDELGLRTDKYLNKRIEEMKLNADEVTLIGIDPGPSFDHEEEYEILQAVEDEMPSIQTWTPTQRIVLEGFENVTKRGIVDYGLFGVVVPWEIGLNYLKFGIGDTKTEYLIGAHGVSSEIKGYLRKIDVIIDQHLFENVACLWSDINANSKYVLLARRGSFQGFFERDWVLFDIDSEFVEFVPKDPVKYGKWKKYIKRKNHLNYQEWVFDVELKALKKDLCIYVSSRLRFLFL